MKTSAIRAGVVPRGCWPRSHRVTDVLSYLQVQAVFESELVDATRETRVREPRFGDERGELAVGGALRGSFRHGAVRSPAFRAFECPERL
ncbi:hypothetical protein STENM327S_00857 [Streptomyces tendae]